MLESTEVIELAIKLGWNFKSLYVASTGSTYIDLYRTQDSKKEWVQVRIANHKQVYQHWMIVISIAPCDYWFEELEEILTKPFGTVGDIL